MPVLMVDKQYKKKYIYDMEKEIPVFKIIIDEKDEITGVNMISLVDEPAMEVSWLKMSKMKNLQFEANKDKKLLYGVFIMPDQKIERWDEGLGKYYVIFEKPEIEKIVKKFNKNNFNKNINFMHGENMVEGYVVENFITSDKVKANYGFEVPEGAWCGTVYIESDEFWETYVKSGELNGFSIEIKSWLVEHEMSKHPLLEQLHDELMDLLKQDMDDDEIYEKIKRKLDTEKFLMVSPTAGESKNDFMGRCIPTLIKEGKSQEQAAAICYNYYENK